MSLLTILTAGTLASAGWPNVFPTESSGWVGSVGNHRYAVEVTNTYSDSAVVHLPWRRRDGDGYNSTEIIVSSGKDHTETTYCTVLNDNNEINSSIAFSTNTGPGTYYIYYLPFTTCGYAGGGCTASGSAVYVKRKSCTKSPWWQGSLPEATVIKYEARSDFHSFSEYERAVSQVEAATFQQKCSKTGQSFVLVTESKYNKIILRSIPEPWLGRPCDSLGRLEEGAQPGEMFTFQIAALNVDVKPVGIQRISFTELAGASGIIPSSNWFSLSTNGTDYWGRKQIMHPSVSQMEVLPLWVGVNISKTVQSGTYQGNVTVIDTNGVSQSVQLVLTIAGPVLENNGDDDYWRGTRLAWFDSTSGFDSSPPPPFTPLSATNITANGMTLQMLSKHVSVNKAGLLSQATIFNDEAQSRAAFYTQAASVFATDMQFAVTDKVGGVRKYDYVFKSEANTGMISNWTSVSTNSEMSISASGDATGYFDFVVKFTSSKSSETSFDLIVPFDLTNAVFSIGLGKEGGFFNETHSGAKWKWDGVNGNNGAWLGSTAAGARVFLKGDDDLWQAAVPFDGRSTPPTPTSWSNNGNGGISILPSATLVATSGYRNVQVGEVLTFRFSVMLTPTRPLNLPKHFENRYAQLDMPEDYASLAKDGATVVNMHQGNQVNPWINYPYLTNSLMNDTASEVHSHGMKFKVYDTMRELSNHATEIFAMRAFGGTFVYSGSKPVNSGSSWLQEHLYDEYEVAWATTLSTPKPIDGYLPYPIEQDDAVKVKALSRWNNYYVQGLYQITRDYSCDGIYLDEIAYDRITMMRAKKALGPDSLIDHHSDCGAFTPSPAMNYMELYPFIDSLWYGEGFKYDTATPDYWLAEISGVPFGLNSDMLRYTGMTPFPYRGMLVASANRWQCGFGQPVGSCPFDPRDIWSLWKSFDITSSIMFGWWLSYENPSFTSPVVASSQHLKITSYIKKGSETLIVIASFTNSMVSCTLAIDWDAVGLSAATSELVSPTLKPMQPEAHVYGVTSPIPIKGDSGLILILKHK